MGEESGGGRLMAFGFRHGGIKCIVFAILIVQEERKDGLFYRSRVENHERANTSAMCFAAASRSALVAGEPGPPDPTMLPVLPDR